MNGANNPSQICYHFSTDDSLPSGTRLEYRLKTYLDQMPAERRLAEEIFERIRQQEFPDRPSRLDCVFVAPLGSNYFLRRRRHVYEVRCSGLMFRTDMELYGEACITLEDMPRAISDAEDIARKYWRGTEGNKPEILVDGSAVISQKISR